MTIRISGNQAWVDNNIRLFDNGSYFDYKNYVYFNPRRKIDLEPITGEPLIDLVFVSGDNREQLRLTKYGERKEATQPLW